MTNTFIDNTYVDTEGRRVIWNNSVRNVVFYSASAESWDRTGGGVTSWYLEDTLPTDNFYGSELDEDKWSFFNHIGTISGSVDNRLVLNVNNAEARGGVTSNGLWSLSGDFDVKLYIDETSYYNEYRSETSTGLTVSINDLYKLRISKYFDGTDIGYKSQYISGEPIEFLGWLDNSSINTSVGEDSVTCLRIKRESGVLYPYVSTDSGFVLVGPGLDSSVWSQNADIEIEVQTDQYNTYKMNALGISVSGTLSEPTTFSSSFRGDDKIFPERSLLIVDDSGLSILDESDLSLWMRFINSSDYMFKAADTKISASNGSIYYTTASGILSLDFVDDKAKWFVKGAKRETDVGLSSRNFKCPFYDTGSSTVVVDDIVLDVSAKTLNSDDFVFVATVSGTGILINGSDEKVGPVGSTQESVISESGHLYWNQYDEETGRGKLYYRESITNLVNDPSSTFSETSYYSEDTSPITLTSENINSISVKEVLPLRKVAVGHSFGIDYIDEDGVRTYGPVNINNPFVDPFFDSYLGISWQKFVSGATPSSDGVSSLFPSFDVLTTDTWSSASTKSLKMLLKENEYVRNNSFGGVYQQLNLSDVDKVYFDYKLVSGSSSNLIDLEVVINGTIVRTVSDAAGTHEASNVVLDVSVYIGVCIFEFRIRSKYSGEGDISNIFYVDNIRTVQKVPDYSIIPTSTHSIIEVLVIYELTDKKIFFSAADGYGSIDITTNTLDFFTEITDVVPLSSVISSEYVEYVDAV